MDYEKEYKEALERARKLYEQGTITESLCYVFPELKESEDEKTRKIIIALVNAHGQGMYKDDMLAWLENIPYTIDHEKREGFHLGYKAALEKQGTSYTKRDVDDAYLKGISDAKNELEKQGKQKPILDFNADDWYVSKVDGKIHNIYHSVDKVEPKFEVGDYIERKDGLGCHAKVIYIGKNVYGCEKLIYTKDSSPFFELMFENQDEFRISPDFQQKPAWSEEDTIKIHNLITIVKCGGSIKTDLRDEYEDWLKSLRPQPKQEWSEEDEMTIKILIGLVETYFCGCIDKSEKNRVLDWLKSLKQRIGG